MWGLKGLGFRKRAIQIMDLETLRRARPETEALVLMMNT